MAHEYANSPFVSARYKLKEYEKRSYKNFDLHEKLKKEAKAKAAAKLAKSAANS